MTEFSGWWTTDPAPSGHQVVEYSQVHVSIAAEIIAACAAFEGVAPGYLNELAGTVTGANTVEIDSGGAIGDGKWYQNDAPENVNIPSAVGGGNTRIDRIVLRVDWATFTAEITRIAGTDAGSPTAPSVTKIPGTTYDILLYQALVNTSGTVQITDEREMAHVGTSGIQDNAVTLVKLPDGVLAADAAGRAKMADSFVTLVKLAADSVDDTKAGNRVPQFYRRQGGSSTIWSTVGTSTQTPGAVRMQAGARTLSAGPTTITFPVAFSQAPLVICQVVQGAAGFTVITSSITASNFAATVANQSDVAVAGTIHWLAIGPE